jgi:hypothetical protein
MMWPFKKKEPAGFVKIVIDSLKLHPHDWKMSSTKEWSQGWAKYIEVLRLKHKTSELCLIDESSKTYAGWKIENDTIVITRNDSKLLSKAVLEWREFHWKLALVKETDHDKILKEALEEVEKLTK